MPTIRDMASVKIPAVIDHALASTLNLYCRYNPTDKGKFRIWKFFRAYFSHRRLHAISKSVFGGTFRCDLSDYVQASIYLFGMWEPAITAYLRETLKPGDVFIDIGANVGYYSVLAGMLVGERGKVFAIEASPITFQLLNANVSRNNLANVRSVNVAVTDVPGDFPLWNPDETNIGQSTILASRDRTAGASEITVRGLPLEQIIPLADILDATVIKIDVEGAEWLVLQGMRHILPRLSPRTEILVECSAPSLRSIGASVEDFLKLFTDAGFAAYVVNGKSNEPYCPLSTSGTIAPLRDEFSRHDTIDLLFRRQIQ